MHMEAKQCATKQPMDHWRNQRGNHKYLETNENESTKNQNLRDIAKAVLRGKFIVIQAYLRKQGKSQTDYLNLLLKKLEKEQTKQKLVEERNHKVQSRNK